MKVKPAEIGEVISLSISVILILALFIYLTGAIIMREDNPHVPVTAEAQNAVSLPEGGYIVPINIRNTGERTLSYIKLSVNLGAEQEQEIEVDYLPRRSSRIIYVYADAAYTADRIQFSPLYYKLD